MTEFTPELAGRVAQTAIFSEWRHLIGAGHLTEAGLLGIRLRLVHGGEFAAGPAREAMSLEVDDAIAALRGIEPGDMPGRDPVPDFPPEDL